MLSQKVVPTVQLFVKVLFELGAQRKFFYEASKSTLSFHTVCDVLL